MKRIPYRTLTLVRATSIASVLLILCSVVSASEQIEDSELGFRMSLPSGFQKHPAIVDANPNIAHAFILGDPDDDQPDILLLVERMRGTIGREPLSVVQMSPDFKGALFTTTWKGFELQGFEVPETLQGLEFVTLNIEVPLKREAILLKYFGPMERKAELNTIMTETLSGLDGESNWIPSVGGSSTNTSKRYGTILLITGIVIVIVGLIVLWLISRKTPKGTILVVAAVIYAAGWGLDGIRIREVLLLGGILKMTGFAGGILGIIDLVRKRKPVDQIVQADIVDE